MMKKINLKNFALLFAILALIVSILWAHNNVKNANEMKRMKLMSSMADNTKVLSWMMKKQIPFDNDLAIEVLNAIDALSKATPATLEINDKDLILIFKREII